MADSQESNQGGAAGNWIVALGLIGAMGLTLAGLFFFSDNAKPAANPSMKFEEIQKSLKAVPEATLVIGVEVDGHAKAYRIQDLLRPDQHAINDRIGEIPVAITFCDIDRCKRIFVRPKSSDLKSDAPKKTEAPEIRVSGMHRDRPGKLLLAIGDKKFWQDTGLELGSQEKKVDLPLLEYKETTWGEWKALHPDSEIHQIPLSR